MRVYKMKDATLDVLITCHMPPSLVAGGIV